MNPHVHVRHPKEILDKAKNDIKKNNLLLYLNDVVLEWITNHVLASVLLFDIALIVPLLTLQAPDSVKITLGLTRARICFANGNLLIAQAIQPT